MKIRDGPAAVIGDKHRINATVGNEATFQTTGLPVHSVERGRRTYKTGRRGCKDDPKVRRPALKRAMFPLDREHHRILSKKGIPWIGYGNGPGFFVSRTRKFLTFLEGK